MNISVVNMRKVESPKQNNLLAYFDLVIEEAFKIKHCCLYGDNDRYWVFFPYINPKTQYAHPIRRDVYDNIVELASKKYQMLKE